MIKSGDNNVAVFRDNKLKGLSTAATHKYRYIH